MPTYKNISDSLFQDGDLIVKPGDSFSTENPGRVEQMTGLYAWQFQETGGQAPSDEELKNRPLEAHVQEVRVAGHVTVDNEGAQAAVVGSPDPVDPKAAQAETAKATRAKK